MLQGQAPDAARPGLAARRTIFRAARDGPASRPGRLGCCLARGCRASGGYGVTTGQAVAPLVVHTIRPWMAGLTGEFASM